MAQEREKGDVKVVENKRPSDKLVKRGTPKGLLERRVSQKQVIALQDGRNGETGMVGFKMHKVNGIVPVVAESNAVIADKDKSIGIALFDPKLIEESAIDELLLSLDTSIVDPEKVKKEQEEQFAKITSENEEASKKIQEEKDEIAAERAKLEEEKKQLAKEKAKEKAKS